MPGSGSDRSPDANHYKAVLHDVFAQCVLIHRGPFSARTSRTTLNHLRLLRAEETRARVSYVSLPPDIVCISFSLDPAVSLVCRGLTLEAGEIMLHSLGESLHQRTVGASRWGLVSLPPASLAAFGKAMTGSSFGPPELSQVLRPCARDRQQLLRIHADAAHLAETRPQILAHPEVIRAMEQDLGAVLLTCLTESGRPIETDAVRHAADIMVRFEKTLASRPPQEWLIGDVCAALGVSMRKLRDCCGAFLGIKST